MKMKLRYFGLIIFLVFSNLFIIKSCSERAETVSCFPQPRISVSINLNTPYYYSQLSIKGWAYIDEQESGTRGLILFKTLRGDIYVFDRNAPQICPDTNTTLEVAEGNLKVICPKNAAEWLYTGEPLNDAAKIPLKRYYPTYDALTGQLNIYY